MILGTIAILGMSVGEFVAIATFATAMMSGLIWIRTKLIELDIKVIEIQKRMKANEELVEKTQNELWAETDKINTKLEEKIDRIDNKLDHMMDAINSIKITCAGRAPLRSRNNESNGT